LEIDLEKKTLKKTLLAAGDLVIIKTKMSVFPTTAVAVVLNFATLPAAKEVKSLFDFYQKNQLI